MKRIIAVMIICFFISGAALAGTTENCGCGVGSMAFEGQNGLLSQLAATFTNGICTNQAFGITFGTLGCERAETIAKNELVDKFVARNMDNLAIDIAKGQGETLDALAELMEMPKENRQVFFGKLQNDFGSIYANADVTHKEVIDSIYRIEKGI